MTSVPRICTASHRENWAVESVTIEKELTRSYKKMSSQPEFFISSTGARPVCRYCLLRKSIRTNRNVPRARVLPQRKVHILNRNSPATLPASSRSLKLQQLDGSQRSFMAACASAVFLYRLYCASHSFARPENLRHWRLYSSSLAAGQGPFCLHFWRFPFSISNRGISIRLPRHKASCPMFSMHYDF